MSDVDLLAHIRLDSVDLGESRIVLADNAIAGVALMARRGWTSRVAAMSIFTEWRGKGLGRFLMNQLVDESRARRSTDRGGGDRAEQTRVTAL